MKLRLLSWTGFLAVVVFLYGADEVRADPLRRLTVEQFNKNYKKWIGLEVQVSGRLQAISTNQLRFKKCKVKFKATRRLSKLSKDASNVRVSGELVLDGKRVLVRISTVEELPSDLKRFQSRKLALKRSKLGGWYELGEWAGSLAKFYDDKELAARSLEASAQGVAIERKALKKNNASGLLQLANKAVKLGLTDLRIQSLRHQAYLAMWESAETSEQLEQAITGVAADLSGSEKTAANPANELRVQYKKDPLGVYETAGEGRRLILHRILMTELILKRLQSQLKKDFSNGFAVAADIDREIPEFHALAKEYRNKALAARAEQVSTLSRTEVLELQKKFRDQQEPEKGKEVVASWLHARQRRLADDDVEGRLGLAEEYNVLLGNKDRTAELLIEAYALSPKDKEIVARLKKLGFRLKNGKWLSQRELKATPESELERAMEDGRVLPRMTAAQVIKSLGAPVKIIRSASQDYISEIWFYGQSATSQMAIHLRRRTGDRESRVVATGKARRR